MSIITKKELLENLQIDDQYVREKPWLKPRPKGDKPKKGIPFQKKKGNTDGIPDYFVVNPNQIPGEEVIVVPLGCQEANEFLEQNKDWLKLIERYQNWKKPADQRIPLQLIACKRVRHTPDNKFISTRSVLGNKQGISEKINRRFLPIIRKEFGQKTEEGQEFNEILNLRSIPSIMVDVWESRSFTNRYTPERTNENITFESLNFNSYESANKFLNAVVDRVRGKKNENMHTYYLARQFNEKYRRWEAGRKSNKKYEGKTKILKLDRRGYEALNLDVTLEMLFSIVGKKTNNGFTWTISMKNKFGRKRSDENYIKDGLNTISLNPDGYLDGIISTTVTVPIEKKYDENFTVMDDPIIIGGLEECISDFKNKVKAIDPKSALKIAAYGKKDVVKTN